MPVSEKAENDTKSTHKVFCGAVELENENVQQVWDDQSDIVKVYFSELSSEEKRVVSTAAQLIVKKVVMNHIYGKYSLYALTEGVIFQ